MEAMIAYCGLDCHECGAFLATKANDDAKRQEVAVMWSKEFNADIKTQDINCEGCQSENGVLFSHCQVCEIRKCGVEKGVANCAFCSDYTCDKLTKFHVMAPEAKVRLDGLRGSI